MPAAAAAPDTAGIANAFAAAIPARKADDTQVFHGLFADDHRTVPLAAVVGALWGASNAAAPSNGAPAPNNNVRRHAQPFQRPAADELLMVIHGLSSAKTVR